MLSFGDHEEEGERGEVGYSPLLLRLNRTRVQNVSSSNSSLLPANVKEIAKNSFNQLDNYQKKVANLGIGKSVYCKAGPGSGKTRTLISKFLFTGLRRNSFDGQAIFTFTKNAFEEVKQRAVSLLGENITKVCTISTIHSFVLEIMNQEREKNRENLYSIITKDDLQEKIFKNLFDGVKTQNKVQISQKFRLFEDDLVSIFERISVDIFLKKKNGVDETDRKFCEFVRKMFRKYDTSDTECIDFHTLMVEFHENIYRYDKYLDKFQDVYYDEVQDMDDVQHAFVKDISKISDATQSYFGDPDQRVFSFLKLSYNFDLFAQAQSIDILELKNNYRNPKSIILARKAIKEKKFVLKRPEDEDLDESLFFVRVRTFQELIETVIKFIIQKKDQGTVLVLGRTNSPLKPISKSLERKNIKHELWSDTNHRRDGVVLSSVHRSKGWEAPYTVLVNFVRYEWPYVHHNDIRRTIEEAKEYDHNEFCVVNTALSRTGENGKGECLLISVTDMKHSPSFFYRRTKSPGDSPYFRYIQGYCQNMAYNDKENKLIGELEGLPPVEV